MKKRELYLVAVCTSSFVFCVVVQISRIVKLSNILVSLLAISSVSAGAGTMGLIVQPFDGCIDLG